jgi:hypothetical protein
VNTVNDGKQWLDQQFETDYDLLVRYKSGKWNTLTWSDRQRIDEIREEHHDALMVQMFSIKEETDDPQWYEMLDAWRPRMESEFMVVSGGGERWRLPDLGKWIPEQL